MTTSPEFGENCSELQAEPTDSHHAHNAFPVSRTDGFAISTKKRTGTYSCSRGCKKKVQRKSARSSEGKKESWLILGLRVAIDWMTPLFGVAATSYQCD